MKQLSTLDIAQALATDPSFEGVFAMDKLPTRVGPGRVKLVANLQYSNLPGSHWVAVFLNGNGNGYYFDSFATVPPLEMQCWLTSHCNTWTWNQYCMQKLDDNVLCGYLCIEFLKHV